jgi:DNA-binding NarL/FixJ family response regulator
MASFVGYALNDPDSLATTCDVEVSSREMALDRGRPGLLITVEPRDGASRFWRQSLKDRFALTDREIEVLERVMAGATNKDIARALFIAECTVKKHMQSIAAKVGARSRTAIIHAVTKGVASTV